ncbi:MAG: hypothetical protein JSR21_10535 [Proteobacteria bacterium]|nr:hypothetical protein [Pseudomonadota bacterium]
MAAAALLAIGGISVANAQGGQAIAPGTVYALHSAAAGGCPALDWHLVAGEGNTISGMVAWNNMKSMAHVEGKIGADRTFSMMAKEVSGPKVGATAKVTGTAQTDGWLVANINGEGVKCEGVKIPIWRASGGTQQ